MIYTLLIIALIACVIYIYYSYMQNKKQFDKVYTELADNLIVLNKLDKYCKAKAKELTEQIDDQTERNKFHEQQLGQMDVALINLIDVPFIENELAPGYAKEWSGEVPYKITDIFVGAELKMSNGYVYTINDIKDKTITISKK